MKLPQTVSDSVRRRNPELFNHRDPATDKAASVSFSVLRQSSKPKLNKTEAEFEAMLKQEHPDDFITSQDITFRLGNGCRYTPDFVLFSPLANKIEAYEIKGERRRDSRWFTDDARVKIVCAARAFPFITWRVCWKEEGVWRFQNVLP